MNIEFVKYQGTGNDFVMLNNLNGLFDALTIAEIQKICSRKFGIGADGLIKISNSEKYDFEVEYYNADGSQSFCGNGARCSVAFAKSLGLVISGKTSFLAIDGEHNAIIDGDIVRLEMLPVASFEKVEEDFILDTGSPHYIHFVKANKADIVSFGKEIRYSRRFADKGINVNQVEIIDSNSIRVETYERGVEDETLSCGTGVTACALIYMNQFSHLNRVDIETKGGRLSVESDSYSEKEGFINVWLSGPAKRVFDGNINI